MCLADDKIYQTKEMRADMTVNDVIGILERLSPLQNACSWDNVGLMVGDESAQVSKILVTLDVDEAALQKAADNGADMIVSHHPLIFKSINKITSDNITGRRIITLIKNNTACFAMHTNFDICGSMGQAAADVLGLKNSRTLEVTDEDGNGLGRIADVADGGVMTAVQWAERIKKCFDIPNVKVFGDTKKNIYRAAVYPGSGSGAIKAAIEEKADLLVTGDIGHHSGTDAAAQGLVIIDAGHYGIEHIFIKYIADYIRENLPEIPVVEADIKNPFQII